MTKKNEARTFVAISFWVMAAFLYFSSMSPFLFDSNEKNRSLGAISAILIAIGGLMFRSSRLSRMIKSGGGGVLSLRRKNILSIFSLALFLMMAAIIFWGAVAVYFKIISSSPLNIIIAPFGFLFFYVGKRCLL